jgi:copper chaperone CopZ
MTTVDVVYRYGKTPTEAAVLGIARLREVYGIRRVQFSEAEKTVTVEYDSTRLSEQVVHQLLRRGGLDVVEKVVLYAPPVPVEAAPAS